VGVRGILALVVGAATLVLATPAAALVDPSFADGVLTIRGDDEADAVDISCVDDQVDVGGASTVGDPIACADVTSIVVEMGGGDDGVGLDEVTADAFPALADLSVDAGDGDDWIIGGPLAEDIHGGTGDDRLTVNGSDGDDDYVVTTALVEDRVSHEDDTISELEHFVFNLRPGTNRVDASAGPGTFELFGSDGADILIGGSLRDTLDAGDGDDVLDGRGGDDELHGGSGADTVTLAGGDDDVDGEGDSDRYVVTFGSIASASIADTGAEGLDTISVTNLCSTVAIAHASGSITQGDATLTYSGIDAPPTCSADPPPAPPPPAASPPPPAPPPPTPPPAAAPPPPAALPPAPPRTPTTKKPVKITVCHKGKTKKVTKAQLKKLKGAKRGACKPKRKTTTRR
jgi:Ca2+-binding RTX toxin-like protein